jgi:hypothetical protein
MWFQSCLKLPPFIEICFCLSAIGSTPSRKKTGASAQDEDLADSSRR